MFRNVTVWLVIRADGRLTVLRLKVRVSECDFCYCYSILTICVSNT